MVTVFGEIVKSITKKPRANNLKVMFLGGIGEIGKNMTVLEYGKDIVVIDCGVMFPSIEMLGIDLVVPDITYLVENKDKVRGFVVTHGHEDHIGSVPYVVNEVNAPIYASKMTCGLIKKKMEEHKKVEYKTVAVKNKVWYHSLDTKIKKASNIISKNYYELLNIYISR